jgi:hypothetical protein
MKETVNHPDHYAKGRKYEPVDVIRDWGLSFNLGNAVKYVSRVGRKEDSIEDLKKAIFYTQHEIDYLLGEILIETRNKNPDERVSTGRLISEMPLSTTHK